MYLTTGRYMTTSEAAEAFPGQSMALAPAQQGMPPSATHLIAKPFQTLQVAGDRVVDVTTLHHTMQPLTHDVCRLMAAAHQRFAQSGQQRSLKPDQTGAQGGVGRRLRSAGGGSRSLPFSDGRAEGAPHRDRLSWRLPPLPAWISTRFGSEKWEGTFRLCCQMCANCLHRLAHN